MNTKEKHVRENERHANDNSDLIAEGMLAEGKNRKRKSTMKINKLWLWLGVLVLIIILLYWLFSIGMMEDLMGTING